MVRRLVLLLMHRREILLPTILIKIFEAVNVGHHELDLAAPGGGLTSCILTLAIIYLGMLEDADGLRGLQGQKRVVKLGKLLLLFEQSALLELSLVVLLRQLHFEVDGIIR